MSTEVRWQETSLEAVVSWVGWELGVAAAHDSLDRAYYSHSVIGNQSVTQYAPVVGGVIGLELPLGKQVSLGAEARVLWMGFAHNGPRLDDPAPGYTLTDRLYGSAYRPSVWFLPGLGATLRLPL